jgi:hypothetical protein
LVEDRQGAVSYAPAPQTVHRLATPPWQYDPDGHATHWVSADAVHDAAICTPFPQVLQGVDAVAPIGQ